MNDLVVGDNTILGQLVIVTVRPDGGFVAGFPWWPKDGVVLPGEPAYMTVEVTTLPLLTAAVYGILLRGQ